MIPDRIVEETEKDLKTPDDPVEFRFLTSKQIRFVAAWTGNLVAAARTAGYQNPKAAAYRLMQDPNVVKALQHKQGSMLQESGEHLARTLPLSRADVIDRLWQLAQLSPRETNSNITGQVKAAQALEEIFALNIDENDLLKRQLEGRSQEELEFYVVHGFLPHQEHKLAKNADPPQLAESTGSATAVPEPMSETPAPVAAVAASSEPAEEKSDSQPQ
jgi:phage terminase small subunit